VIVSSTPYGTEGLFAKLYHQAASGELADATAHHATTAEVNPTIDAAFLEREERRDPDSFKGEYLADFLTSGNAYLDFDRFEVATRGPLEPDQARGWVAGLDPAFSRDPFGLAIVGQDPSDTGRLVLGVMDALKPSRLPGGFDRKLDQVIEVCNRYAVREVVTDQYAAPAIIDRLEAAGLHVEAVHQSAASKTAAFAELRTKLYNGTLELYEHPSLVAELRRLRTRFTVGQAAVENPRVGGSHGDLAQAVALAVDHVARTGTGEVSNTRRLLGSNGGRERQDERPLYMRVGADPAHPLHRKWSRYNFCDCANCTAERETLEEAGR
jgi:phage terminase large subunit-like protein